MSTAMQSLRPLAERMRRGWRVSPLPGFLHWWGGELRELLPVRWRGWFSRGADWHLLQHSGAQWTLRRSGQREPLAMPMTPRLATSMHRQPRWFPPCAASIRKTVGWPCCCRRPWCCAGR
jgi:hypothetical protein